MHLIALRFFLITVMSLISRIIVMFAIEDCSMMLLIILIELVIIVRLLVLFNLAGTF